MHANTPKEAPNTTTNQDLGGDVFDALYRVAAVTDLPCWVVGGLGGMQECLESFQKNSASLWGSKK